MSVVDIADRLRAGLADRYDVGERLGEGGMAWVYRGVDRKHGRAVAIKVMRPELGAVLGADRFLREIEIVARLSHPHVVPLFDSGQIEDLLYYVMPLVEGETLRRRLERTGRLDPREVGEIGRDVAAALDYAHRHGIIRRDIKPENVLLVGNDALVADFGIAHALEASATRATGTGVALGTIAYMSPEQATGERPVDGRSDLYSLGCMLYEALTGEGPHGAGSAHELLARRLSGRGPDLARVPPGAPPALVLAIRRMLALDPGGRYDSAAEAEAALVGEAGKVEPERRRWGLAVLALVIAAVAMTAIFLVRGRASQTTGSAAGHAASLAVLPFANLSAERENEYLGDGLSEELISALSRVAGLRVAPRTSSFSFKGRNVDVREIGQTLSVGTILEGSVRKSGTALRITARLLRAADGAALWSGEFEDRTLRDVFAIQDSISRAIVREILPRLAASSELIPKFFLTASPEAHDHYLQGRYWWNRRTADGLAKAITAFTSALALDSGYAAAHSGLADAYAITGFYDYLVPAEAFPRARASAERALALDPTAGEPRATLAYVMLYHDWDIAGAEREFQRAIALRPDYAVAHQWYANLLCVAGRYDEADQHWKRARDLEPLSPIMEAASGWMELYRRNYARTAEIERSVLARDSTFVLAHYWLGLAREGLGDSRGAIESLYRGLRWSNRGVLSLTGLGHAFATAGLTDSATAVAGELERRARVEHLPSYEVALVYAGLGKTDSALTWLERAFAERSHSMVFLKTDPRLDPLRGRERFERLVARVERRG